MGRDDEKLRLAITDLTAEVLMLRVALERFLDDGEPYKPFPHKRVEVAAGQPQQEGA